MRDSAGIDTRENPPNFAASRMATLHGPPDRALDNRVLLRLARGRVLAADPSGVAELDVAPAGELPAVVRAEALRAPHAVHVGEKLLHVRDGLRLPLHPVRPHPP